MYFCSQLYPLEVLAGPEVLEAAVCDQGAVVQLQGGEPLPGLAAAQLPDTLVSDQLAVRQRQAVERTEIELSYKQLQNAGVSYLDELRPVLIMKVYV